METEPTRHLIRFYEIDLLRFLAALAVVFFHYTFRGYAADQYSPIPFLELVPVTKYGYLGVELFFIISGYVVLLSAHGKTVRQFFLSRVTRLYPAFWVACTLTFLVERLWGTGPADPHMSPNLQAGLGQYAYNMTMLHEFFGIPSVDGAYWSLTIEVTFYFIISLLIAYDLLRHIDLFLVLWIVCIFLAGTFSSTSAFAYLFFPQYAPYFVAGMVFYLMQQPRGRTWLRYALLFTAFHLAIRTSMAQATVLSEHYHEDISPLVVAVIVTGFFALFTLVSFRRINLGRFSWLTWTGALTYPLYLIHSNIAFVAFHRVGHLLNKYILLGLTLAVMLGAAYLLHVLVEKPFTRPLGKFIDQWFTRLNQEAS